MAGQYNIRSPAVKRLMREAKELKDRTYEYYAQPLEDNLFEWHFTVRGPPDSPYEKGVYHGRILFPPEYPMKPPNVILLTPNGRFELGKKICLSISAHHPETWQPSWSIRTVLVAIRSFMPTKGGGAIGALDYTAQERQALAKRSVNWSCPVCATPNQELLLEQDDEAEEMDADRKRDEELAAQISFKSEAEVKAEVEKAKQATAETAETLQPAQRLDQTVDEPPAVRRRRQRTSESENFAPVESNTGGGGGGRGLTIFAWLLALLLLTLLVRRLYRDEDVPL